MKFNPKANTIETTLANIQYLEQQRIDELNRARESSTTCREEVASANLQIEQLLRKIKILEGRITLRDQEIAQH